MTSNDVIIYYTTVCYCDMSYVYLFESNMIEMFCVFADGLDDVELADVLFGCRGIRGSIWWFSSRSHCQRDVGPGRPPWVRCARLWDTIIEVSKSDIFFTSHRDWPRCGGAYHQHLLCPLCKWHRITASTCFKDAGLIGHIWCAIEFL